MSLPQPDVSKSQRFAYEALIHLFHQHEDEVMEIEIVPTGFQPPDGIFFQDSDGLGIQKATLIQAYVEARQRFSEYITSNEMSSTALTATKVILLFDPGHITAANFRKRRLLALKKEVGTQNRKAYHVALKQELCFLNTILTSPLHRQSKSPTLWYHRLWMMEPFALLELEDASEEQKLGFWHNEIVAVCKSGEQHPKNYYAWQYARRLLSMIGSPAIFDDWAHHVKRWCCMHPSDISGWSFLLFLMPSLRSASQRQEMAKGVLDYAINLKLEQESIWVFIRATLSQRGLYGDCTENLQMLQEYKDKIAQLKEKSSIYERVSKILFWVDTYGDPTTPGIEADLN